MTIFGWDLAYTLGLIASACLAIWLAKLFVSAISRRNGPDDNIDKWSQSALAGAVAGPLSVPIYFLSFWLITMALDRVASTVADTQLLMLISVMAFYFTVLTTILSLAFTAVVHLVDKLRGI